MPILYITTLLIAVLIIALFWFMQTQTGRVHEFPSFNEREDSYGDLFLNGNLLKIENFADKGKVILFVSITLILIEFFAVIFWFARNQTYAQASFEVNDVYVLGGILFFILLLFSTFAAIRLTTVSREMPTFGDGFAWSKIYWERKIQDLSEEQKKQLSLFLLDKIRLLEQNYHIALVMLSSSLTLFIVWIAHWLIMVTHP